jgi:hypothetical protein
MVKVEESFCCKPQGEVHRGLLHGGLLDTRRANRAWTFNEVPRFFGSSDIFLQLFRSEHPEHKRPDKKQI